MPEDTAPKKKRELQPFQRLAFRFYCEFLGNEKFDARFGGRHLKDAQRLCAPKADDGEPLDADTVYNCCVWLRAGGAEFDGDISSMSIVAYGEPPFYRQYQAWAANPPPHYRLYEVKLWEKLTGRIAYAESGDIIIPTPTFPSFLPHL